MFKNNLFDGIGNYTKESIIYEGEFTSGVFNG